MEVWIGMIVLGGVICLVGLYIAYLGILSSVFPEKLRTREVGTVITPDLWKLRICRFRRGRTEGEPVLLVHGMGVNHHNFTEPANACLVDYLVERGFDCWALDLRGTHSSKAPFERDPMAISLDDYLMQDVPAAIEHIRKATGYGKVHYVGHSLGGMLLYAYAVQFGPGHLASAATLGAPLGFDGVKVPLAIRFLPLLRRAPHFWADVIKGMLPFAAPFRVNTPLFPINARNIHPGLRTGDFYNMIDLPVPSVFAEMVQILRTKQWKMNKGTLDIKAGFAKMDVPLLAIYGTRDPFIPMDWARKFYDGLPGDDRQILICSREHGAKHDYDHCDLAFGVDGAKTVFKPIADWFAAHPIKERVSLSPEAHAHMHTPLDGEERAEMLSGDVYAKTEDTDAPVLVETPPAAESAEASSEYLRERQAVLQGFAMRVAPARGTADVARPKARPALRGTDAARPAGAKKAAVKATASKPVAKRAAKAAVVSPLLEKLEDSDPIDEVVDSAAPAKAKATAKPKAKPKPKSAGVKLTPGKPPAKAKAATAKPKAKAAAKPAATKPAPAKKSPAKSTTTAAKAKPAPKAAAAKAKPAPKAKAAPAKTKPGAKPAPAKRKPGTLDVLKAASEELKKLDKRK